MKFKVHQDAVITKTVNIAAHRLKELIEECVDEAIPLDAVVSVDGFGDLHDSQCVTVTWKA